MDFKESLAIFRETNSGWLRLQNCRVNWFPDKGFLFTDDIASSDVIRGFKRCHPCVTRIVDLLHRLL